MLFYKAVENYFFVLYYLLLHKFMTVTKITTENQFRVYLCLFLSLTLFLQVHFCQYRFYLDRFINYRIATTA